MNKSFYICNRKRKQQCLTLKQKIMKIMNKALDVFCKILTEYFLLWCPKETAKDCSCAKCSEDEMEQYKKYYTRATRWAWTTMEWNLNWAILKIIGIDQFTLPFIFLHSSNTPFHNSYRRTSESFSFPFYKHLTFKSWEGSFTRIPFLLH